MIGSVVQDRRLGEEQRRLARAVLAQVQWDGAVRDSSMAPELRAIRLRIRKCKRELRDLLHTTGDRLSLCL